MFDPDATADRLYDLADFDPTAPPGALSLAYRLLGPDGVELSNNLGKPAIYDATQKRILVRKRMGRAEQNFCLVHEVVEWHFTEIDFNPSNREQLCNQVAARLIIPRQSLRTVLPLCNGSIRDVAEWYRTSETVAGLRRGEVTGLPTAVVTTEWIAVRGDVWGWPPERQLRLIAGGRIVRPELERTVLADCRRRVMLVAA